MNIYESLELKKQQFIGDDLIITTVMEADTIHRKFIKLRELLYCDIDVVPYYRGEQKYGWDIQSGIFRSPLNITDPKIGKQLEEKAIQKFEIAINDKIGQKAFRKIYSREKYGKEWDLLFNAQHAGIKTTLTDWSDEILTALYFATEESKNRTIDNSAGQIWCFMVPDKYILGHNVYLQRDTFYDLNPFDMKQMYLICSPFYITDINHRIFEYRMFRQKGRFLILPNDSCHVPLNNNEEFKKFIFRIKIPAKLKKSIRKDLTAYNMTRKDMFIEEKPDVHDLIAEINDTVYKDPNLPLVFAEE